MKSLLDSVRVMTISNEVGKIQIYIHQETHGMCQWSADGHFKNLDLPKYV